MNRDQVKSQIESVFRQNVLGRIPDLSGFNSSHDGAEGDWLTKQMGLSVNGLNEPDFHGFEMKKPTHSKTSFGDWSPDIAIYKGKAKKLSRTDFLETFGSKKLVLKGGITVERYSWSGSVFPKYGTFNDFGQRIVVDAEGNIEVEYVHSENRNNESRSGIPDQFHGEKIVLAKWTAQVLRKKVESKFNQFGWFKPIKDETGTYVGLQFGKPLNYTNFINLFKSKDVFLDCGMHVGNVRPYMTFRASNKVWDRLAE